MPKGIGFYTEIKEGFHGDAQRFTADEEGEKGGLF